MKLCTFEVSTHLGRHSRLGAFKDGRITDLNFATAWYMAQTGEAEPQRFADALVPANLLDFLRAGLRARHTAEELFLGAGPDPHDWWKRDQPPRGPNDETLVYRPDEVRLRAPLAEIEGHVHLAGPGEEVPWPSSADKLDFRLELAAVIGRYGSSRRTADERPYIAGFTVRNAFHAHTIALGPWLVTPDEIRDPYNLEMITRVNGTEWSRFNSCILSGKFEQMIEVLSRDGGILPGRVLAASAAPEPVRKVQRGDLIELEIEKIGTLQNRVV